MDKKMLTRLGRSGLAMGMMMVSTAHQFGRRIAGTLCRGKTCPAGR